MPALFTEDLLHCLLAISEGHRRGPATNAIKIGQPRREFDQNRIHPRIPKSWAQNTVHGRAEFMLAGLVLEVTAVGRCQIRVPFELRMLGKTCFQSISVWSRAGATIRSHASPVQCRADFTAASAQEFVTSGNLFSGVLELKIWFNDCPRRLNKFSLRWPTMNSRVSFEFALDEKLERSGSQKIANRSTAEPYYRQP